jgi:drug/metabolite transporter (DMT)-like permease
MNDSFFSREVDAMILLIVATSIIIVGYFYRKSRGELTSSMKTILYICMVGLVIGIALYLSAYFKIPLVDTLFLSK